MTAEQRPQPAGPTHDAVSPPKAAAGAEGHLPAEGRAESAPAAADPLKGLPATTVDMLSFAHLLNAAQQSGLVPNADAIAWARDCDFRAGRYQRAFDVIQGLYKQMDVSAARRQGELRREEMQYRSGTLKMSPKEWLVRQRRVMEQTQKIDRARRQFARVLDGLNVLRSSRAEEPPPDETPPQET